MKLCLSDFEINSNLDIELCSTCKPLALSYNKLIINVQVIEFLMRYYSLCDIVRGLLLYERYKVEMTKRDLLMEISKKYSKYFELILDFITFYQWP